jgi:hypothetical protein
VAISGDGIGQAAGSLRWTAILWRHKEHIGQIHLEDSRRYRTGNTLPFNNRETNR